MLGKDAGLRIRVEKALREDFIGVCRARHRPASQVLREFMRQYVAQNGNVKNEAMAEPRPDDELGHS